jgi:hypothetical protein
VPDGSSFTQTYGHCLRVRAGGGWFESHPVQSMRFRAAAAQPVISSTIGRRTGARTQDQQSKVISQ